MGTLWTLEGLSGFCLQTVQTVLDSWDSWAKWLPTATLTVSDYCDRFVTKFTDERARLPVLELRGYPQSDSEPELPEAQ